MNKLTEIYWIARAVGIENLPRRIWRQIGNKTGIDKLRLPGGELSQERLRQQFVNTYKQEDALEHWRLRASRFFISSEQLPDLCVALKSIISLQMWKENVKDVLQDLQHGKMLFFNHLVANIGPFFDFNRDPIHNVNWPVDRHWSTYTQFDPELKDIKCIWEASRFAPAYLLARDYARDNSEFAKERFWQLFNSWDKQNPYGLTVQWACGQESTFRMMAWLFAAFVFLDNCKCNAGHYHRLTELAWYTARHIERNINYARSQKNNHAFSEAVGLWTIGLLFPEFKRADIWRKKGQEILTDEVERQIYMDGSYVQHSLNYHRLMMDDLIWAIRLAQINHMPFPDIVQERLGLALNWLLEMIDPQTGRVPNYGANDGASVLPLSCCDYLDYRPVAQAAYYLLYRKCCFQPGPWDEKMLWLFGPDALGTPVEQRERKPGFAGDTGGYYILRGTNSQAMIRCHSFRDRPAHADMLHVDLWYKGINVFRDGGSYIYYSPGLWQGYFNSTAAHNTIEIDNTSQMVKGPRFLWFRWIRSKLFRFETLDDGSAGYFEGEQYGYTRLPGCPVHRRSVCRVADSYIVIDDILGFGRHHIALRWRLCEADWQLREGLYESEIDGHKITLTILAPDTMTSSLERGKQIPVPEGWESLYYGEKKPAPVIVVEGQTRLPFCMLTVISMPEKTISVKDFNTADPNRPVLFEGTINKETTGRINQLSGGRIEFC